MFQSGPFLKATPMKTAYDAVIAGGGVHGLSAAYFLARHRGMRRVAVMEGRCIGSGASGRNTAILRANQRTPENVALYKEGLALWPRLTKELDINLMFRQCGLLTLAHTETDLADFQIHATLARHMGTELALLTPDECGKLAPGLNLDAEAHHPVLGGMHHPQGATIRHDAVIYGLARGALRSGVDIHQETPITAIRNAGQGTITVETPEGAVETPLLLIAAGDGSDHLARMAGVALPTTRMKAHALVTQPLKPFLDPILSSGAYPCYANQTLKGEIVACGPMEPTASDDTSPSFDAIQRLAFALTELLPCLSGVKLMRTWAGLLDATPDMAPIMDASPKTGVFLDCGWGDFGFKSGPVAGKYMAEFMATGRKPEILNPFSFERFDRFQFLGETQHPADGVLS